MQQFHLILGQEHNKNRNSDLCTANELVNHISIFFSIFLFNKTYILNYKKKITKYNICQNTLCISAIEHHV